MDFDTSERYDRQIRLWGTHGQSKFGSAKICLINANALGTEILKNLCLPGIGSFTIIDSNKISGVDIGNNFFVTPDRIGTNRAATAKELLLDLNDEVTAECIEQPIDTMLPVEISSTARSSAISDRNVNVFWSQFSCVVACGQFSEQQIIKLSRVCWNHDIPLIMCRTLGFIGYIRVQTREHFIIEAHPDNSLPDLRLDRPFEALKAHFESISFDYSNVARMNEYPYVVLLYRFLAEWQAKNGFPQDRLPVNYEEKKQIKQLIESAMKKIKESVVDDRHVELENFNEATKAINSVFPTTKSNESNLAQLFQHPRVTNGRAESIKFWQIVQAIKTYVSQHNDARLPVSGTLPDMASSTHEYVRLQQVYRKKSKEDTDAVFNLCQEMMDVAGGSPGHVSYDDVRLVCQNIRNVQIVRTSPVYSEYSNSSVFDHVEEDQESRQSQTSAIDIDDEDSMAYYLALRSIDKFYSTHGRYPGYRTEQVETDMPKLRQCYKDLSIKLTHAASSKSIDQHLYELCRYGGAELHTVASFIGGCVAQEVIKLITNQYVPLAGCFLYNGMMSTSKTFAL